MTNSVDIPDHFDSMLLDQKSTAPTSQALIQRIAELERELKSAKLELETTRSGKDLAQESKEIADFRAQQQLLDHAAVEATFEARLQKTLQEQTDKLRQEHYEEVAKLCMNASALAAQLEDEQQRNQRLLVVASNESNRQTAKRELASHLADLERRNAALRKAVDAERSEKETLVLKLKNAETRAENSAENAQKALDAESEVRLLKSELENTQNKLDLESKLAKSQGVAMHQTITVLRKALNMDDVNNSSGRQQDSDQHDDPVALSNALAAKVTAMDSALKTLTDRDDRRENLIVEEKLNADESKAETEVVCEALQLAQSRLSQLTDVIEELEGKLLFAEERAAAAENQVDALQQANACSGERTTGMRKAAIDTMKESASLKEQIAVEHHQIRKIAAAVLSTKDVNGLPVSEIVSRLVDVALKLKAEKRIATEQRRSLKQKVKLLTDQMASINRVSETVLQYSGASEETTLYALVQATQRIAELERLNTELQQSIDAMYRSSTQDWSEVRNDMERVVAHAEQAQRDAEIALQRSEAEKHALQKQLKHYASQAVMDFSTEGQEGRIAAIHPKETTTSSDSSIKATLHLKLKKQAEKIAMIEAELATTSAMATTAEQRCLYLDQQLQQATTLCTQQATALQKSAQDLERERYERSNLQNFADEVVVLKQQLDISKQRCDVLESRLEVLKGMGDAENSGQSSRLLRRYMSGMTALARALGQLQESPAPLQEATSSPEKLVDALLLHLHARDLDLTAMKAQVEGLQSEMRRVLCVE